MATATKVKATLVKISYDYRTYERLPNETLEIEADSDDELLALFFREYKNRYKYCNTGGVRSPGSGMAREVRELDLGRAQLRRQWRGHVVARASRLTASTD